MGSHGIQYVWTKNSTTGDDDTDRIAQAPGDAEAELACLNCKGRIDAVISEDSDALVFGAQAVIRVYVCSLSSPLIVG